MTSSVQQSAMFEIAVVGITSDPPTLGHGWLATTAWRTGLFDQVWLMPCYKHRLGKEPASPWHRFRMCEMLAEDLDGPIIASPWEMMLQLDGTSLYTYNHLRALYKDWKFTWVVGMDNALSIDNWAYSDRLKAGEVPFLVCGRGGVTAPEGTPWFHHEPHKYVEGSNAPVCSSSEFREQFKQAPWKLYNKFVTLKVLNYILEQGLYQ